jgi:hypothetical protein
MLMALGMLLIYLFVPAIFVATLYNWGPRGQRFGLALWNGLSFGGLMLIFGWIMVWMGNPI